jgi:uncharacterized protein (TIGR03084 family)
MDSIVDALAEQQAELSSLLDPLDDDGWAKPSPCEGWSVADVVLHLVQTNGMAQASLDDRYDEFLEEMLVGARIATDVDDGAAAMVERDRGMPNDELNERWRTEAAALTASFAAADPHRRVQWVVGRLSVRTLTTTRLAETWIHTGDVAEALGILLPPTPRLEHIARLAWRTLPYAFERGGRTLTGPVAFELEGPDGAPWRFTPDGDALTTIRGPGAELCMVAGRRVEPGETDLEGDGPDAAAVLELVRTYA